MDPNATLALIETDLSTGDRRNAAAGRCDLGEWLARGGFPPAWEAYPLADVFCSALTHREQS